MAGRPAGSIIRALESISEGESRLFTAISHLEVPSTEGLLYRAKFKGERDVVIKVAYAMDLGTKRKYVMQSELFAPGKGYRNIVQVLNGGEVDGRPYIVMERADDNVNTDYMRQFSIEQRVAAVGCLIDGLSELHEINLSGTQLVHRDLKPQNCLLFSGVTRTRSSSSELVAKITDFGYVVGVGHSTSAKGTFPYLPPEAQGGSDEDLHSAQSVDVWSLALVAYEILTLRRNPLMNSSEGFMTAAHAQKLIRQRVVDFKAHQDLDFEGIEIYRDFLIGALHIDPSKRYNRGADMKQAWEDSLASAKKKITHIVVGATSSSNSAQPETSVPLDLGLTNYSPKPRVRVDYGGANMVPIVVSRQSSPIIKEFRSPIPRVTVSGLAEQRDLDLSSIDDIVQPALLKVKQHLLNKKDHSYSAADITIAGNAYKSAVVRLRKLNSAVNFADNAYESALQEAHHTEAKDVTIPLATHKIRESVTKIFSEQALNYARLFGLVGKLRAEIGLLGDRREAQDLQKVKLLDELVHQVELAHSELQAWKEGFDFLSTVEVEEK